MDNSPDIRAIDTKPKCKAENCRSITSQPVKQSTSRSSGIFKLQPGGSVTSLPRKLHNSIHRLAQSSGRLQNINTLSVSTLLF